MTSELQEILALEFYSNDLDETLSVREYLKTLLKTLWQEGEGFSGKRPLGNSGWERDLAVPLLRGGYIQGEWDDVEEGWIDWIDDQEYNKIILNCIDAL